MCERCDGAGLDRSIEVTEDNVGLMIHETTHVALQAAAAYSNGWYDAAQGFVSDMAETWGGHGMVRMAYVWGAGWFFLPAPPGADSTPGHKQIGLMARLISGKEPDPAQVAQQVALADQIGAACKAIAGHASKGEPDKIADLMDDFGDEDEFRKLLLILMAGCGIRLRNSRDIDDTTSYELFMAHIHADLRPDDEGEGIEGEESDGGTTL